MFQHRHTLIVGTMLLAVGIFAQSVRVFAQSDETDSPDSVTPDWGSARLICGDDSIAVQQYRKSWPFERVVGELLIRISESQIEAFDRQSRKTLWSVESPTKTEYLGQSHGTMYLSMNPQSTKDGNHGNAIVRRLRLRDGSWLGAIEIPLTDGERKEITRFVDGLAVEQGMVALLTTENEDFPRNELVSYRIALVKDNVVWSTRFDSAGTRELPNAFLLGSLGPSRDLADIQRLCHLGSDVLVCAGPLEDLIKLDTDSGRIDWRIPRLWEFQRGFIGPSVWQYFIGRYGFEEHDAERAVLTKEEIEIKNEAEDGFFMDLDYFEEMRNNFIAAKERTEKRACAIVAGPVVVPDPTDKENERIFVVTSQSDSEQWSSYLSDCVIYELDASGTVNGLTTIPRFVYGDRFHILDRSVVWQCQGNRFARLYASTDRGPDDCIIETDWTAARPTKREKAWLRQGAWYSAADFFGQFVLRAQKGGQIETMDAQLIRYPLVLSNLKSGHERVLLLELPFKGRVKPPQNNYSRSGGEWTTLAEFLMTLKRIRVRGSTIEITFVLNDEEHSLEFVAGTLLNTRLPE